MAINMTTAGMPGKLNLRDVGFWKVVDVREWDDVNQTANVYIQFWAGNPDAASPPTPPKPFESQKRCVIRNGECQGFRRKAEADQAHVTDVIEEKSIEVLTGFDDLANAYFKVPAANAAPRKKAMEQVAAFLLSSGIMDATLAGT